jgi:epoxyqueuosine reductase
MNSAPAHTVASFSLRIKQEAQRLGFDLVGISPVRSPAHESSFADWLRQGFAGEMGYMGRTADLRRRPEELVPWAVAVISGGINYQTAYDHPRQANGITGWISRYAWGDDYHELMKRRLDSLLVKITEFHDGPVQGRAFVDSGPVLERNFAGVAGLGWIGKNTNLISPKKGSWFFRRAISEHSPRV